MGISSKILKQITPKTIKNELHEIQEVILPAKLQEWITSYKKIGIRSDFVWHLFFKIDGEIDYIPRPLSNYDSLQETKFLIAMFVVLLDDIADQDGGKELFNKLSVIPFIADPVSIESLTPTEKEYFNFTLKVWERIHYLIINSPQVKYLGDQFIFDTKQMINAMEYSNLISKYPNLINKTEYWLYSPHSMQFIVGGIVNMMFLDQFVSSELQTIREIIWQIQKMARIGNCISTWEREIVDRDFTSGVFAYAIDSQIITSNDLLSDANIVIKKIKKAKIENSLLKEWEKCYREISHYKKKVTMLNIEKLLYSLEKLLLFEIISKKYK